jgi:anti-anti-sigma factor
MPTAAKITSEAKGNAYVIHLEGEIDVSILSQMETAIKPLLADINIQAFILDCKNLMFIDSKVVGYMAYLYTTLTHSQRKFMFAAPNETVNDILTLVGLTSIVSSFKTVDEALSNI